jgi:hypothetical protein
MQNETQRGWKYPSNATKIFLMGYDWDFDKRMNFIDYLILRKVTAS